MKYVLCLVLISLLTGCQTKYDVPNQKNSRGHRTHVTQKTNKAIPKKVVPTDRDGAPPGPLPSFFRKIFPVHAPLSRYGNPDVYRVNGHTYQVLSSSSGYRTRGLASWYGTKFHSRRTSSGEEYNMYALTAAHKTLPLPTYVRVKNLSNGRVAIVKVNDRGPFHSGRVIDLSYAAAAKLGMMPKGTAPVEIEALTSTAPGKAKPAHYYLQAGAFNSAQLAETLRAKIAKMSPSTVFVEKYQHRYIVRVGPFANRQMSDRLKQTLKNNGVTGAFSVLI